MSYRLRYLEYNPGAGQKTGGDVKGWLTPQLIFLDTCDFSDGEYAACIETIPQVQLANSGTNTAIIVRTRFVNRGLGGLVRVDGAGLYTWGGGL